MILLVDNYDSFSYNLVQMIGELVNGKEELKVIRNDELTVEEILNLNPSHIILSPGPGKPSDAGVMEELIQKVEGKIPLIGVCLGHQAICEALGGKVTYAKNLMHGKKSHIKINNKVALFADLPENIEVARYHSLVADPKFIPDCLEVIAEDINGEVMAVRHKESEIYGLQFHPESIMTPNGKEMMQAFLNIA